MIPKQKLVLPNVDHYRVTEAMVEGLRVILSYRGEPFSPAYLQGISGAAFNVSGICPCAPTCSSFTSPQDLAKQFGYQVDYAPLFGDGVDLTRDVPILVARIKDDIRNGHPVLVWHAFTYAEWDVVCGFNEEMSTFNGRGSYFGMDEYAAADEGRTATCLDICPALGAIFIGEKTGQLDAQTAEINSLKKALDHAYSSKNKDKLGGSDWVFLEGLACYDRWIDTFMNSSYIPNMGDRYCFNVYRSTHRTAGDYLRELSENYPQASGSLEGAAVHFDMEAAGLHTCAELTLSASSDRNLTAVNGLTTSRNHYARAMDCIAQALEDIAGG
jgi:hypothetical protein